MKTKLTLFIISILFLSACSTTYYSSIPYDDVYYNGQAQVANNQVDNSQYSEAEVYEGEYESEYLEGEQEGYQDEYEYPSYYNDFDAYYNYLFSARLRRFHRPYYSFGYYNNYFTNMYWYELNPYVWGSSIYLNTGWMLPYEYGGWSGNFYAGLSWGFGGYGMGWPYYNHGWPYGYGHYNYYGMGYGMYSPFYGYGYYNPFHYHDYYYNSRDSYSQYYRHRPNRGRNYNRPNGQLNTFGEMYEKRYYASRDDRNSNNAQRRSTRDAKSFTNKTLSVGTPTNGRNRSNTTIANGSASGAFSGTPYSRLNNASGNASIQKNTANQRAKSYAKPQDSRKSTAVNSSRRNLQKTRSVKTYKKPILKYGKPNATRSTNNRNSNTKQFNSRQDYSNPGRRVSTTSSNRTRSSNSTMKSLKRIISTPTRSSRSYTSPSRSNSKPISVSRSSGKRSFSTPSRSSSRKSFSSPSRSSRSISSSSRSSSSVSRSSSSSSKSSSGSSSRGKRK